MKIISGLRLLLLFVLGVLLFVFAELRLFSLWDVVPNFVLALGYGVIFAIFSAGYSKGVAAMFFLCYSAFVAVFWFVYLREALVSLFFLGGYSLVFGSVLKRFVLDAGIASILGTLSSLAVYSFFDLGELVFYQVFLEVIFNLLVTVIFYFLSRKLMPTFFSFGDDKIRL